EIHTQFVFGSKAQVPKRIHKDSGSSAYFIAEHGNTSASMVISLDNDILHLVSQVLLDGGFMLLLDFRVISQYADGAKRLPTAALVSGKKFLHRIRRVRAVI